MPAKICIIGLTFGKLKVIADAETAKLPSGQTRRHSVCMCACGRSVIVSNSHLRCGHTASCGCIKTDAPSRLTHGHAGNKDRWATKTYKTWSSMFDRCENPRSPRFKDYGGRGIIVCERWRSFRNFMADMGEARAGFTLDRKNTDGNYEPENCRWATRKEQARNKRNNRMVTVNGVTAALSEHCENYGVPYEKTRNRLVWG